MTPVTDDTQRYHSRLGLIILSLVVGELLLGLATTISKAFGKSIYSIQYSRKLHQIIGWSLLIVALVNNAYG